MNQLENKIMNQLMNRVWVRRGPITESVNESINGPKSNVFGSNTSFSFCFFNLWVFFLDASFLPLMYSNPDFNFFFLVYTETAIAYGYDLSSQEGCAT